MTGDGRLLHTRERFTGRLALLLLRFFRRWLEFGGLGGCFRLRASSSHDGLGVPEIGRHGGDFFWRIAQFGRKTSEGRYRSFHRFRVHLLEFLEAFLTQNVAKSRVLVEAAQGTAQSGDVVGAALAALGSLGNKQRLRIRIFFTSGLGLF